MDANKNILVVILTFYHFLLGKYLNDFALDDNKNPQNFIELLMKFLQLY